MGDCIRVAVRVRPFNHRESDRNARLILSTNGPQTTITNPETEETRTFTFDYSYWSHDEFEEEDDGLLVPISEKYSDQRRIFDDLGTAVLANANKGFNCSILAYGQTGAGKSYTMSGTGANDGLIPNICDALFAQIAENKDPKLEFQVRISMLEVYNEKVRDLLNKRSPVDGLKVRQHPKLGVQVVGLTEVAVGSYEDIANRIEEGTTNRTIASTEMNAVSSRGHTIVTVSLTKIEKDAKGPGRHKEQLSKINLVDLAGSDRVDASEVAGDRLREGSAINLSLTMFGNVITALAEKAMHPKKKIIIPYREAKLTQILQDALGGNSKTIFVAALSPADINYEETLEALRYADRAKRVKNKAVVNVDPTELLTTQLKEENKKLMEQLQAMMKDGTLPAEPTDELGAPISEEEREEMRRQLQSEMAEQVLLSLLHRIPCRPMIDYAACVDRVSVLSLASHARMWPCERS
jgi:kinesin family protein 1